MTPYADDIESFTGDPAGATILRRSLRELAALQAGTPLAERVADVLAGRLSMRELAEDPELVGFAHEGMWAFDEMWQRMTPDERAEALAAGQAYEADLEREV